MDALLYEDIIYMASDVTAGVFLIVLTASIAMHMSRHKGLSHLLAAAGFTMGGIFTRITAGIMDVIPDAFEWIAGVRLVTPALATVLWIIAYSLLTLGIAESVTYVIYINEENNKKGLGARYVAAAVFIAASAVLFCVFKNINVFTALILAQFGFFWLLLHREWSENAWRDFVTASAFAVTAFAVALVVNPVRLTGLGLSVMMLILGMEYHSHVRAELAGKEEALAKSRVQLLTEQISPHFIYNSLQSISGLCETDPAKARDAIDTFSDYLRGNLESLTEKDLISFSRELEYTRAYLEMETISGLRRFVAEYDLEVTDFMLPPLVLQPVVENAVKHGTAKTKITIATREKDGSIYIEVTATEEISTETMQHAPESAQNRNKRRSVGLENVRSRLELQCSGTLDVNIFSEGSKVTITLPASQHIEQQNYM